LAPEISRAFLKKPMIRKSHDAVLFLKPVCVTMGLAASRQLDVDRTPWKNKWHGQRDSFDYKFGGTQFHDAL